MDKNKENNNPESIKVSQSLKKLQKTMNNLKAVPTFEWLNNINKLQKLIESFQESSKIFDNILNELTERNINVEIIGELGLSEIINLYCLSNNSGLTFADLAEDSLKLFGILKYEQALTYLELLNSRKKQIVKNDLKSVNFNDDFYEDLKYIEESMESFIKLNLQAYEKGEIKLTPEEKNLLVALKKNKFLKNTQLAKILGYSVRNIEAICANIRRKFEIDFIEDKSAKRRLLLTLAKHINL